MSIRLMIADDHELARAGLATMVAGTEVEIACQAVDSKQAADMARKCHPDVIILDVRMPEGDGFQALETIKAECPNTPVLMISASDSLAEIAQARTMGAKGYISKAASRDELLTAIRKAAQGRDAWTRQQIRRVSNTACEYNPVMTDTAALTPREQEVLKKLAEGHINEEIAQELKINVETVKHHVTHILSKLGVEHRTQAAVWAVRNGML